MVSIRVRCALEGDVLAPLYPPSLYRLKCRKYGELACEGGDLEIMSACEHTRTRTRTRTHTHSYTRAIRLVTLWPRISR